MPDDSMRDAARKARAIVQFAVPLVAAAIALPLIGGVYLALFEDGGGIASAVRRLIAAAPAFVLLTALFAVVGVLREYETGRFLSLKASAGLKRVGRDGLIAMILQFMLLPIAFAVLDGAPWIEALRIDGFNIAVMMFAAAVLSVGGLLERASQALKADNDQIV